MAYYSRCYMVLALLCETGVNYPTLKGGVFPRRPLHPRKIKESRVRAESERDAVPWSRRAHDTRINIGSRQPPSWCVRAVQMRPYLQCAFSMGMMWVV